jgi:uncharacterized protein YjbI with pentapeptide repeats
MTRLRTFHVAALWATLVAILAPALVARADIYQWGYINPADPNLGKQPSTALAPDGAGVNAERGADLSNRNLTMAYLIRADLSAMPWGGGEFGDDFFPSKLTGVNLSQADLTDANLSMAWLYNANLNGAEVRGANFSRSVSFGYGSGITAAQLYSTASYLARDLTGINLEANAFAHVNLVGQNLTNAVFRGAALTGADLTAAEIRGADFSYSGITAAQLYSTVSYNTHDLSGIGLGSNELSGINLAAQNLSSGYFLGATLNGANFNEANAINANFLLAGLSGANFGHANLTNANLSGAGLTGANLEGARVQGAKFYRYDEGEGTGLTPEQLYSTASYQEHNLAGIGLIRNDLSGVNLAGQDLTNSGFSYATMANANLSGADARGANFLYATLSGANTSNLIQSDGHIASLDLTAGASLVVRDYDGNSAATPPTGPLPIIVEQQLSMDATGDLRLVFDADPWGSTISFAPGIPVALGGTLHLAFAPDVDLASQLGRTINLFDWTGVTPIGAFTVSSPYAWDLSELYTTGEVSLASLPGLGGGDFNGDGRIDDADLTNWKTNFGATGSASHTQGDADGDHDVDGADFLTWQQQLGNAVTVDASSAAVPEPAALLLLVSTAPAMLLRRLVAVS